MGTVTIESVRVKIEVVKMMSDDMRRETYHRPTSLLELKMVDAIEGLTEIVEMLVDAHDPTK